LEKLRTKLEDQLGGRIPSSLEETIKAGENQLKDMEELPRDIIEDQGEKEKSVVESSGKHSQAWELFGAGKFVRSVLSSGLRLNFAMVELVHTKNQN
jgi:hypothetical protein